MTRWLYTRRPQEVAYVVSVIEAALIWKVYLG
jgi:hypothetical protein